MATQGRAAEATPEWYRRAIAHKPTVHHMTFEGNKVSYLKWSRNAADDDWQEAELTHAVSPSLSGNTPLEQHPTSCGIVLVHGTFAHAHWWDFIAPLLADSYDVIALDLPGCGDSDHADRCVVLCEPV